MSERSETHGLYGWQEKHTVRSVRIVSDPAVVDSSENEITVTASVIAAIFHRQQTIYAGNLSYKLLKNDDGLKIKMKRVDLLNADAPLDIIMMHI